MTKKRSAFFLVQYSNIIFIVLLLLAVLNLVVQKNSELGWFPSFVLSEVIFLILALFLSQAPKYLYRIFSSLSSPLEQLSADKQGHLEWFSTQLNFTFNHRNSLYLMAILPIAGIITLEVTGIPWYGITRYLFHLFMALLFALLGGVGWIFIGTLIFLYNLSKRPKQISPLMSFHKEIKKINDAYFQMYLIGLFIYISALAAGWSSPGGLEVIQAYPIAQFWVFPIAGVVLSYFLVQQYLLHSTMVGIKYEKLSRLDKLVDKHFGNWQSSPSDEQAKIIDNLLSWKEYVNKEPEWPMDIKSTLSLVGGILLPIAKTIIDLI